MTKLTLSTLLAFAAVSMAHAEDVKILKIDPNSHADHVQLVAAAEQLCRSARLHDLFDDYGTQEECVENTLQGVQQRQDWERANDTTRISSAR
jgi:LmbE family N-acetylglucosaminyl deacetylase